MSSMKVLSMSLMVILAGSRLKPAQAQEQEPRCTSGFGCEYQVLLRLSELETRLKEQEIRLKDQERTIEALKTNLRLREEVAFSAYLTSDVTGFGNYRTIVFDFVLTNIGGAYNEETGIFNCRKDGVYIFHWVITNKDRSYMDSELVVNNQEMCQAFSDSGDHTDYSSASNMVVVELKDGDLVWVRSGTWHNGRFGGEKRSSFSGWLLYTH